jgi:phage-related protein (TIGR01555 family)
MKHSQSWAMSRFGQLRRALKTELRVDSLVNTLTGLGVAAHDKVTAARFRHGSRLSDPTLAAMFNCDDMAARIVEVFPDEGLRMGWTLNVEADGIDAERATQIAADTHQWLEQNLFLTKRLGDGWTWGRLFGLGGLWPTLDEGEDVDQSEPLDPTRVRRIMSLVPFTLREVSVLRFYDDATHPKFGEPELYMIQPTSGHSGPTITIHESRLIVFGGARTMPRDRSIGRGADFSVLQRPHDVLRQFGISFQALTHLIQDASQGVFKMRGLIDALAGDQGDDVRTRMEMVDMGRSVARAVLLDAEGEDFTRTTPNLTGYPPALQVIMQRLAGAAKMPVTVLMGMSPAGMNATGESDRLIFAGTVEAERERVLTPRLIEIVKLAFMSTDGPTGGFVPASWSIGYPSLVVMSEADRATVRKTVAETDQIYVNIGVLTPEEIAVNRFTGDFSMETTIDMDGRADMIAADQNPDDGEPEDRVDQRIIQALIFSKEAFGLPGMATAWARNHGFSVPKIEESETTFRIRQFDPAGFASDSFRTIELADGVQAVTAMPGENRTDQGGHIHELPGGGFTAPGRGDPHSHALPDGRRTALSMPGPGHTHRLPNRKGRTGGPIEPEPSDDGDEG